MHLRVGGFTIRVTGAARDLRLAPGRAAARFLVDPSAADVDVEIDVVVRDLDARVSGECLFDSRGPWRLYRDDRGLLFQFVSPALESSPYKIARFDSRLSTGQISLHRPYFQDASSIDPLEYPLDELLVLHLLAQGNGVEVHGCGVVPDTSRDGATGYVFAGPSGAGKTTMARIWLEEPGAVVLSDDRVILRREADGLWMYGTPWHGDEPLASPRRARVGAIFLLRHGDRHHIAPVARAEAVARLFAASFPLFYDARALDFTLAFLDRVAGHVPCLDLAFIPDRSVVGAVRRGG